MSAAAVHDSRAMPAALGKAAQIDSDNGSMRNGISNQFGRSTDSIAKNGQRRRRAQDTRELDVLARELAQERMYPQMMIPDSASFSESIRHAGIGSRAASPYSATPMNMSTSSLVRPSMAGARSPGGDSLPGSPSMQMPSFSPDTAYSSVFGLPEGMFVGVNDSPYPTMQRRVDIVDYDAHGNVRMPQQMYARPGMGFSSPGARRPDPRRRQVSGRMPGSVFGSTSNLPALSEAAPLDGQYVSQDEGTGEQPAVPVHSGAALSQSPQIPEPLSPSSGLFSPQIPASPSQPHMTPSASVLSVGATDTRPLGTPYQTPGRPSQKPYATRTPETPRRNMYKLGNNSIASFLSRKPKNKEPPVPKVPDTYKTPGQPASTSTARPAPPQEPAPKTPKGRKGGIFSWLRPKKKAETKNVSISKPTPAPGRPAPPPQLRNVQSSPALSQKGLPSAPEPSEPSVPEPSEPSEPSAPAEPMAPQQPTSAQADTTQQDTVTESSWAQSRANASADVTFQSVPPVASTPQPAPDSHTSVDASKEYENASNAYYNEQPTNVVSTEPAAQDPSRPSNRLTTDSIFGAYAMEPTPAPARESTLAPPVGSLSFLGSAAPQYMQTYAAPTEGQRETTYYSEPAAETQGAYTFSQPAGGENMAYTYSQRSDAQGTTASSVRTETADQRPQLGDTHTTHSEATFVTGPVHGAAARKGAAEDVDPYSDGAPAWAATGPSGDVGDDSLFTAETHQPQTQPYEPLAPVTSMSPLLRDGELPWTEPLSGPAEQPYGAAISHDTQTSAGGVASGANPHQPRDSAAFMRNILDSYQEESPTQTPKVTGQTQAPAPGGSPPSLSPEMTLSVHGFAINDQEPTTPTRPVRSSERRTQAIPWEPEDNGLAPPLQWKRAAPVAL